MKKGKVMISVEVQIGYMVKNYAPDADRNLDFFEGYLIVGNSKWWYQLTIMSNEKMEELKLKKSFLPHDRIAFKIELEKDEGTIVELSDEEYRVFFWIFAQAQIEIATKMGEAMEKLRETDYEEMKASCLQLGDICPVASKLTIGFETDLKTLNLLNSPKFNCQIAS